MNALKEKLAARRAGLACHDDFLQSFVSDDSSTDSQILDNVLTLIIAGYVHQCVISSSIRIDQAHPDKRMPVQAKSPQRVH